MTAVIPWRQLVRVCLCRSVKMSLFRLEAINAQRTTHLGVIRVRSRAGFWWIASISGLLVGSLVAFAAFASVTRRTQIPGVLLPASGAIQVLAPAGGVLSEISATEGQMLGQGDRIFVIVTDRTGMAGGTASMVSHILEQRRATLDAERRIREVQARQRNEALTSRVRGVGLELEAAEREREWAARRVALAHRTYERFAQLAASGFVADTQLQQRQEELLDLQGRSDAAARVVQGLHREREALRAEVAAVESQLAADLAVIERAEAGLDQETVENDTRKQQLVVAPRTGRLATLLVAPGTAVAPGQALAVVVPGETPASTALEAHLFAPSRAAGFVRAGQVAWLRIAAFPHQKFGMPRAVVTDVSATPIGPSELPTGQAAALLQAAGANEALYRIRARLDAQSVTAYGESQPLKAGMTIEADVVQDRRAVWEWLFDPLLSTGSRIAVQAK